VGGAMKRVCRESVGKRARGDGGGRNERGEWGRVEKSRYIFRILPESGESMTSLRIEVEGRRLLRKGIRENSRYGRETADFVLRRRYSLPHAEPCRVDFHWAVSLIIVYSLSHVLVLLSTWVEFFAVGGEGHLYWTLYLPHVHIRVEGHH